MSNAWALGLYSYAAHHPGAEGFKAFYDAVLTAFSGLGLTPTYFAVEGLGFKGDLTKWGGRIHDKALKSGFSDIHVMSLVANPEDSDEPGYDSFASGSLAYVGENGETLLSLMIEEQYLEFGSKSFEDILASLIALQPWAFGYALCQPIKKKPEFHVLAMDAGELTAEDRRRLNAWYASMPEERLRKPRDVYPYVFLNEVQLAGRVTVSKTLGEFIQSDVRLSLTRCKDSPLWLWKTPSSLVEEVREQLLPSGILIS